MDGTYLQIELQRVGLCLQRAVQSWKLAGQDPDDAFRGLYITDVEAESLLARPLASGWGHTVSLPPEIETSLERQMALVRREAQAVIDESVRCGHTPTLENLRAIFGLSQFELDTLLICLAPSVDLRYERIFGYLQDDVTKKRPSVSLILDLLADTGIGRMALLAHFDQTAPLLRHHLLELRGPAEAQAAPLLSCFLYVDESILSWLLGSYRPHSDLTGALVLDVQPAAGLEPFVDAAVSQQIVDVAASPLYVFHGPDAEAQLVAGRLVASTTGSPLLIANLGAAIEGGRTGLLRTVQLALRDARLTRAVPMFTGWDVCLVDGTTPPAVLHELDGFQGTVIVAGQALWYPRGRQRGKPALAIEFAVPSYEQRHRLWAHFIDALGDDAGSAQGHTVAADDLEALAGQFMLTSGQIRDAATTARDQALGRGARIDGQDLFAAARAHSNPRLATLAHKIEPHYGWDDIILPDDQRLLLMEIVDTVRGRPQVLDAWGVGQKLASSRGVTVLFAGPPGTGKTMAAEIIAGELGLDLYRIDLSTIVSKYIGETEKNIERIFQEAEQSNAILFFDEADALFGKRSEVRDSHDRYANIEISYLLQRMESYDGVTILATNLRGNLDEAFTRRLQFAVAFPFPEAEDRARIWDTLFPPGVPRAPDVDLDHLAQTFRLAGGNIRNVIVSAAYLAAADGDRVTMAHLLHATRRELQKMGRLVRQEDLVFGS
jgi:ATP-dependent 26S proteasome regulatory subunit